jgi:hypothetical protein
MKTQTLEPHYLDENGALVVLVSRLLSTCENRAHGMKFEDAVAARQNQEAHMLGRWLESGVFMALRKKVGALIFN